MQVPRVNVLSHSAYTAMTSISATQNVPDRPEFIPLSTAQTYQEDHEFVCTIAGLYQLKQLSPSTNGTPRGQHMKENDQTSDMIEADHRQEE